MTRWLAAEALDIALTKRGKHLGEDISMCEVAASFRGRLSVDPDQKRVSGRGLRTDGKPCGGREKRQQISRKTRCCAACHAGNVNRGNAFRGAPT